MKCPKFKNMLRTYRIEAEEIKDEELLVWILHSIMGKLCFSANVRQCKTALSVVHVHLRS